MVERWPLTGRGEELRMIGEALTDVEHRGVVLAGPAGVGKTRLARAAADAAAQRGWSVRRVAGTATGRAVTLGAFARWADPSDPSPLSLTRNLFGGPSEESDAAQLLLVDDAHLLDDLSALIVHQLALHGTVRVIATIRTGEPAPDAITALWKDSLLDRLELQPLSRNESDRLLQTVLDGPVSPECADRMWRLSRGNVLYLHHLVEHERQCGRLVRVDDLWRSTGTASASTSLIELVESQIGAVPDDVGEVVDLVALAEPLDRSLLSKLADPDVIEAAEQRELIRAASDGDAIYVGHPLYGEIRLGRGGALRLRRLRGRLAGVMAQSPTVDPLRLGLLWLESDQPPDVEILSVATQIAGSRFDVVLAERLARAALETQANPLTKLQLAWVLFLRENGTEAEAILDTLDVHELAVPGLVDGVMLRAANLLWPARDPAQSADVIEAALLVSDERRGASLRAFRAVQHAMAARPATTLTTMDGVDYAGLDNFSRLFGYSAETIALGDLGRVGAAAAKAAAGYRVLDESPQDSFHGTGLAEFHAYALLAAGHVVEAHNVSERQHRQYAEWPGMSRSMAEAALGMTALGMGELNAALRHLDAAKGGFGDYGNVSGLFYRFRILYTEALARCGRIHDARVAMEATRGDRHPAYQYVESGYLLASAWVAAGQGRTVDAREITQRATDFARSNGQLAREVWCLQTAAQFGDTSGANRLAELAALVEGPRAGVAARYAKALSDDDAGALDAVSLELQALGDLLAAADAAAQASTSHRRAGRRGSALTSSARARLIAKDCGGAVSPALSAALVPLPFTAREHEVATLLSGGLSNREIASAMAVSVRTVEGHIYLASAKAGVSSRAELSTLVRHFQQLEANPTPG
jgi:DNA-binding NarL/FixJ family response regulator